MSSSLIDRLGGYRSSLALKAPCRVATTANITLAGLQTIDGITVVDGDRVLVKNQTTASGNGIYVVSSGAWVRSQDFNAAGDVAKGTRVYVHSGTAEAGEYEVTASDPILVGSSSITWSIALIKTLTTELSTTPTAETRTAIKAIDTSLTKVAYLKEAGREGWFEWKLGNYATQTAADTNEGKYLVSNGSAATVGAWVREPGVYSASVKWFGAIGDGTTDDTTSIQNAITYVSGLGGGSVYFPPGIYKTSSVLTVTGQDVRLVGDMTSGNHNSGSATIGKCTIEGSHTSGAIIRLQAVGQGIEYITLSSDATRYAAAATSYVNCGIRIEALDTANLTVNRVFLKHVHVMRQPGDGIVMIGTMVNADFYMVDVDNVGGWGMLFDGGAYTGRANVSRPGQVNLNNIRSSRTGNGGFRIGTNTTGAAQLPYRFYVNNLETFFNCQTTGNYSYYLHGEHITIEHSAVSGVSSTGVDDHYGMYINGRCIRIFNQRLLDCNPQCAIVDNAAGGGVTSTDIEFDAIYITQSLRGAGFFNPAISVDSGVKNFKIGYHESDASVSFVCSVTALNTEANVEDVKRYYGLQQVGGLRAMETFTLADDAAGYITFAGACQGIAAISGSVSGAGATIVHFRCGDASAHCTVIASSAGITVGTGTTALLGTTGTDIRLNVAAVAANNRLYIENRTGASRSYVVTILSATSYATSFT